MQSMQFTPCAPIVQLNAVIYPTTLSNKSSAFDAGCVMGVRSQQTPAARDVRKRFRPHRCYARRIDAALFPVQLWVATVRETVDPLIAINLMGHRGYQATANGYSHSNWEALKNAAFDMDGMFP